MLALAVTASACDVPQVQVGSGDNGPKTPGSTPDVDPDIALARSAVSATRRSIAHLEATMQRFPGLGMRLAPVLAMHRAHLGVLDDAVPKGATTAPPTPADPVPTARSAALQRVVASQVRAHDALVVQAGRARSGSFARLLASMAAAVSQQLAGLGRSDLGR